MNPHADSVQQPSDSDIIKIAETLGKHEPGVSNYDSWGPLGYRLDEDGRYTIPVLPRNVLPFARALLARFARALNPAISHRAPTGQAMGEALKLAEEAIIAIEDWAGYASSHFKQKHGYETEMAGYRERLAALFRFGTRPAAEPINPLSLREAYRPNALDQEWTEHHSRNYPQKAATIINAARQILLAAEPNQSGSAGEVAFPAALQEVWDRYYKGHSSQHELADAIRAAISRQAPAAPAAVDFEQWWLAEVAANGGVPIGADYKHWAKAGFELRGDARAPAAPAEADFEREVEDWEASQPFYDLAWRHGASQHLSFDGDELESLTFSVKDFENFCVALTPAAPTQALLGWTRYEKARKLNPAQWAELHQRNLRGENFDDMIDALPATTQPVQQDTKGGVVDFFRDPLDLVKTIALALERGYEAADILDENSPIRDRIRLIAKGVPTHDELAQRETEGWKLVPVQPTTEMINAGQCGCMDNDVTACIYQKMLDATPPAEKQAAPSGEDNHG